MQRSCLWVRYEDLLLKIVTNDERYIVLTAENRAAIRQLPELLGKRFIDTGITEQALLGIAAGMALRGRIPVVHGLSAFLTMRAFEFIRTDVGVASLPVKLVGSFPGFLSTANGPTHQAVEDVALMRSIPSMHIFCPADEQDLTIGLPQVLGSPNPCYIRLNQLPPVKEHLHSFAIGYSEIISEGSDVAILVYGTLFPQAVEAVDILRDHGLSVGLVNLRMLKPLDETVVLMAAHHASLMVTLEDHLITGGLFSAVGELLLKQGISPRVLPLALEGCYKPALLHDLLHHEGFTGKQIAQKILHEWREVYVELC